MPRLPYSAVPPDLKPAPVELPPSLVGAADAPSGYLADVGLVDSVNVALILRQPLLVTGEPGTGKSQLARSIAYQLGLESPLNFEAKSTSIAKDLFYTFDHIGRFRAAQSDQGNIDAAEFISFNALGMAIILANPPDRVADLLPHGFVHPGQRRSVVLIDEVDKAPRDFPNDILNELERFFFRVPELGGRLVTADDEYRPTVVMTSNSEKSLPEAFLRRCIFYNIPFPPAERLEEIVLSRLSKQFEAGVPLLRDAIEFFVVLRRSDSRLRKRPGTAELLNWLTAMLEFGCTTDLSLRVQERTARATLSTLSKMTEDQEAVRESFQHWVAH